MTSRRRGGSQGINRNVRECDGVYIAVDTYSDSEDSLGSLGSANDKHKGNPLPSLFSPKIPVHIFDQGKKDMFYKEKASKKKKNIKKANKQAWTEQCGSSGGEELKEGGYGEESDEDQSSVNSASASSYSLSSPQQFSSLPIPSPISPSKRAFLQSNKAFLSSPSTVASSPGSSNYSALSSPIHSNSKNSLTSNSHLFSPTKHQLLSTAAVASPSSISSPSFYGESLSPVKIATPPMPYRLRSLHKSLIAQHELMNHTEKIARLHLLSSADRVVSELPLRYLLSKPDLRHYAIERVVRPFMRLLVLKTKVLVQWAFKIWLKPPEIKMNEKQARFMVIADCFAKLLRAVFDRAFQHWAWHFSSRRTKQTSAMRNKAAEDIQRWFRHTKITRQKSFIWFTAIIEACLHRRKAIKHFIKFEQQRRLAIFKLRRAIHHKRRMHYGARAIMRVWRWLKLYRKTQQRLTRRVYAKVIQRWYRMVKTRDAKTLFIIHKIITHGGYSVVLPKVKACTSMGKSHFERTGFILGVDAVVTQLQRAWYKSKGQFALFMMFAARRAKMEYEQMLNENATIIQNNFRGHLWNLLTLAAVQWNRSRRISKSYRSYHYRYWNWNQMVNRSNRMARKIQHMVKAFLFKCKLTHRFKLRKAVLIFTRAKKTMACMMVQRQYRAHVERERIKQELLVAFIAGQRAKAELVAKNISTIQRNWRQLVTKTFPEHVKLVCWRLIRDRRRMYRENAQKIQKRAKQWVLKLIARRNALHKKMANRIWRFAKARMLALALWDRVEARRLKEKLASICMCRNFRLFVFYRIIKTRCILRRALKEYQILRFNHATYIQRWTRRKTIEYVLPVRLAGRRQLKKKRDVEQARRQLQRENKSANILIRLFRLWPLWAKTLKRIDNDRIYYHLRKSAKMIQRFARSLIAWARFDRVVAYKKKCIHEMEMKYLWTLAANVTGHYWKRYREKTTLKTRFANRRNMLDEWHRLEELRLKAMKDRAWALEEKRRTDENMKATIAASWKQGSSTDGKNYYYNYVTGESSWTAPEGWKVPHAVDKWVKQRDERMNVYYYNMETCESSWLPPCGICGSSSERHCEECSIAYCETCYERRHHGEDMEDEEDKNHKWSLVEYEKQKLGPGDVHCLECKKRVAMRMCLTCWDPYCNECFAYTHHVGDLKYHKTMAYRKVKAGWMVVKSKDVESSDGEMRIGDYYMNGSTGETTYEKPIELFTMQEKLFYDNFMSHKKANEDAIKKIEELQFKLEEASFERDSILQDNLAKGNITGAVSNVLKKRTNKAKSALDKDRLNAANKNVILEVQKANKPGPMAWLLGDKVDYKNILLNPSARERGASRSEFMKKLLDEGDQIGGKKKGK